MGCMLRALSQHTTIQLSALKQFAMSNLPEDSALYRVLLVERDQMEPDEFVSKIPLWLALLKQVGTVK